MNIFLENTFMIYPTSLPCEEIGRYRTLRSFDELYVTRAKVCPEVASKTNY